MSPEFDFEIIQSRIEKIRANISYLKEFSILTYEEFATDQKNKVACERLLQICIEAMLDIGSHIIAVAGFEEPKEYRDIFLILAQRRVFETDFAEKLVKMVGLRNRLVHLYLDIDYRKIYDFIKNNLSDFESFVKIILKYISK